MDDLSAVPFEAQTLPDQVSTGLLAEARSFLTGFAFTAVMTVLGAALVTVALVVGVVGAPVIAAVVAYVIFRSRRAERARVLAT
jgi:hypothetical protein